MYVKCKAYDPNVDTISYMDGNICQYITKELMLKMMSKYTGYSNELWSDEVLIKYSKQLFNMIFHDFTLEEFKKFVEQTYSTLNQKIEKHDI